VITSRLLAVIFSWLFALYPLRPPDGGVHASAVGCAVTVGRYPRARRERANAAPRVAHEQELVFTG
jgi:hypothetical protein